MTRAEERILLAIYTAPSLVSADELATVAGTTSRTIRRAARELPALLARTQVARTQRNATVLYWLTGDGIAAIEALSGRRSEAAE